MTQNKYNICGGQEVYEIYDGHDEFSTHEADRV